MVIENDDDRLELGVRVAFLLDLGAFLLVGSEVGPVCDA